MRYEVSLFARILDRLAVAAALSGLSHHLSCPGKDLYKLRTWITMYTRTTPHHKVDNQSVNHKGDDAPDPIDLSAALLHDSVDTADRVLVGHR